MSHTKDPEHPYMATPVRANEVTTTRPLLQTVPRRREAATAIQSTCRQTGGKKQRDAQAEAERKAAKMAAMQAKLKAMGLV